MPDLSLSGNIPLLMPAISAIDAIFEEKYKTSIQNPAQTLEGHINHENAVVNDYRGRAIYEFFQNAIDRAESNIWIRLDSESLTIANDGQPFSIEAQPGQPYSDFEAVCSINTSSKNQNESIGNKGVGFKSCWEYTDLVTVVSIHEGTRWGFSLRYKLTVPEVERFSNKIISDWLTKPDVKEVLDRKCKLPSFYFPEKLDSIADNPAGMDKAVTVITFEQMEPAKVKDLKGKLYDFARQQIFFVQQLSKLSDKNVTLTLQIGEQVLATLQTQPNDEDWLVVPKEFDGDKLKNLLNESKALNYPVEKPRIAVAFPLKENLLLPEETAPANKPAKTSDLSLFYCYLPTRENAGFNVIIHADFLLDASRKQIDFEHNPYNLLLLGHIADLFVETLCENERLHHLPFFAKFLHREGANKKLAQLIENGLIEQGLKPRLAEVMKKVYRKDRQWPIESYRLVFSTIDSWLTDRVDRERHESTKIRNRNRVQPFCGEGIYIVPLSNDKGKLELTYLPLFEDNNHRTSSLFYRPSNETAVLDINLLQTIPNIAISTFEPLSTTFRDLGIVREFRKLNIVRDLANYIKSDSSHKEVVLKFCSQLIKLDEPISRAEFFNADHERAQFGTILLPCTDGTWKPALQCYGDIVDEISKTFHRELYSEVCKETVRKEGDSALTDVQLDALLKAFGVWVGHIPLPKDRKSLPWGSHPPSCPSLKQVINKSILEWCSLDGLETIKQQLLEQKWFSTSSKGLHKPADVFLYEPNYRNVPCIPQEKRNTSLDALYAFLNIRKIDETEDPGKILSQLQRMAKEDPNKGEFHRETYKALTFQLSKLYSKKSSTVNLKGIPILYSSNHGELAYTNSGEAVWFVPAEYKRYKLHFPERRFVHFDFETARSFATACGLTPFKPEFSLEYQDEQNRVCDPLVDDKFKQEFTKPEYLASLLALAESRLDNKLDKDACITRWQRLEVSKAHNVLMIIEGNPVESSKKADVDVFYLPLTDSTRTDDKTLVGELGHDLREPFTNANISKFGPTIAEGVFRNTGLGDLFADYLGKCYLKNEDLRQNFLQTHGVSGADIKAAQDYITQRLLSDNELNALLEALKTIVPDLPDTTCLELHHYKNLDMTLEDLKESLKLGERYEGLLSQLDPRWENEQVIKDHRSVLSLREEYCKQHGISIQPDFDLASLNSDKESLLQKYNFNIEQIYAKYPALRAMSLADLAIFKLQREHGIDPSEATCRTLTVKTLTAGSPQAPPYISTVDVMAAAKKVEDQHKRGIGTEKLICNQAATYVIAQDSSQIRPLIQAMIEVTKSKEFPQKHPNLVRYRDELDKIDLLQIKKEELAELLAELFHISKKVGDGLGYDIFYPDFESDPLRILKVEVKSTRNSSGRIRIYLSENERQRILAFAESQDCNWRLWLNNKGTDVTEEVKSAVVAHGKLLADAGATPLHAETWYLELE